MLITFPPPRSIIRRTTGWVITNTPVRSVRITFSQASTVMSSSGVRSITAALLTSTSMGPTSASIRSTASATWPASVTSNKAPWASMPSAR